MEQQVICADGARNRSGIWWQSRRLIGSPFASDRSISRQAAALGQELAFLDTT